MFRKMSIEFMFLCAEVIIQFASAARRCHFGLLNGVGVSGSKDYPWYSFGKLPVSNQCGTFHVLMLTCLLEHNIDTFIIAFISFSLF
jgi:hypothetical protein